MKSFFLIGALLIATAPAFAQLSCTPPAVPGTGNSGGGGSLNRAVEKIINNKIPQIKVDGKSGTNTHLQDQNQQQRVSSCGPVSYTIPVVVHWIQGYKLTLSGSTYQEVPTTYTATSVVPIVNTMIDKLNSDFGGVSGPGPLCLNADAAKLANSGSPGTTLQSWLNVLGNPHIKFVLATVKYDPATSTSTCRSGIEFSSTAARFRASTAYGNRLYADPVNGVAMKSPSNPQYKAWDPEHYLNIWVCDVRAAGNAANFINGFPLTGYATFPTSYSNLQLNPITGEGLERFVDDNMLKYDGVVVNYRQLSGAATAEPGGIISSAYNSGRIVTHELGHYFNVWHTFETSYASSCGEDYVYDTPATKGSGAGLCGSSPASIPSTANYKRSTVCNPIPGTDGDMYSNHMDYTYDAYRNMFTQQQVDRIIETFKPGSVRAGLLEGVGNGFGFETVQTTTVSILNNSPNPPAKQVSYTFRTHAGLCQTATNYSVAVNIIDPVTGAVIGPFSTSGLGTYTQPGTGGNYKTFSVTFNTYNASVGKQPYAIDIALTGGSTVLHHRVQVDAQIPTGAMAPSPGTSFGTYNPFSPCTAFASDRTDYYLIPPSPDGELMIVDLVDVNSSGGTNAYVTHRLNSLGGYLQSPTTYTATSNPNPVNPIPAFTPNRMYITFYNACGGMVYYYVLPYYGPRPAAPGSSSPTPQGLSANRLLISPNPTNGSITFHLDGEDVLPAGHIVIKSMVGDIRASFDIATDAATFDVANLQNGAYLVEYTAAGKTQHQTLVIQH